MELIKDRLAHIIRAKNLTATQFAEMMQIQPSNVSHLLSGRNKPSLDFLIKLKEVFPEYSFDWIILGKKPITISDRSSQFREELFAPVEMISTNNQEAADDVVLETSVDVVEPKFENKVSSKNIKHIVYVYEDHTFEIYEMRK